MAYRVTQDLQRAFAAIVPPGGPTGPASYWGFWVGDALGDTDFMVRAQYDAVGVLVGGTTKTADFSALFGAAWGSSVQFDLTSGISWARTSIIRAGGDGVGHGALVFLATSSLGGAPHGQRHLVVWDAENGAAYAYTLQGLTVARFLESSGKLYWLEGEVVGGTQYRVLLRSSNRKLGGITTLGQTSLQSLGGGATYVDVGSGNVITGKRRLAMRGNVVHFDDIGTLLGSNVVNLWSDLSGTFVVENFAASGGIIPNGIAQQQSNNPIYPGSAAQSLRHLTEDSDPHAASALWPATGTWLPEVLWVVPSVSGDGLEAGLYDQFSTPNGARIIREPIGGSHGAAPTTDITLAVGPGGVPELGVSPDPPDAAYIRT